MRRWVPGSREEVYIILEFCALNSVATSLWLFVFWAPWVYKVFNERNTVVGVLSAVNGAFEVLGAVSGGFASDSTRFTKHSVVKVAMATGIIAFALLAVGLLSESLWLLLIAQSVLGLFMGLSLSSVEALMADSVPSGSRDDIYSFKNILETSAPLVGCVASVSLMLVLGNTFDVSVLRLANLVGICVQAGAAVQLFVRLQRLQPAASVHLPAEASSSAPDVCPSPVGSRPPEETPHSSDSAEIPSRRDVSFSRVNFLGVCIHVKRIPYVVALHDTVLIVGSGLTTMYFSLFMMDDYGISPVTMALLQGFCAVCTAMLVAVIARVGPAFGRVGSIFVVKTVGSLLLLFIALAHGTSLAPLSVMFVIYGLRYGLMNSCGGVTRSLLMDIVPPSQRARWSAVESLQNASWSGTSAIGGLVADRYGYGTAFLLTFAFHITSTCFLIPCLNTDDRPALFVVASPEDERCELQPAQTQQSGATVD